MTSEAVVAGTSRQAQAESGEETPYIHSAVALRQLVRDERSGRPGPPRWQAGRGIRSLPLRGERVRVRGDNLTATLPLVDAAAAARHDAFAAQPGGGGFVEQDLDLGMQLQERGGNARGDRAAHGLRDDFGLALAGRHQHDRPRVHDRRHAHRQRLFRHVFQLAAEEPGVRAARRQRQLHAVRPRRQLRRRLVEADVAVLADAENLQVDAAGPQDAIFEPRALGVEVLRLAIEEVRLARRQVHVAEQVLAHVGAVAARVRRIDAHELVEVERGDLRVVGFALA